MVLNRKVLPVGVQGTPRFPRLQAVKPPLTLLFQLMLLPVAVAVAQNATPPVLPLEKDILATSIRNKGYPCQALKTMERIELSGPDVRAAWRVHCNEGDYVVVYRGDLGYQVEPLH
jgi:hypothetical protein